MIKLNDLLNSIEDNSLNDFQSQFIGIYDEIDYFNDLIDLTQSDKIILFEDVLDKSIENEKFMNLERIYSIIQDNKSISIKRLVAFMKGFDLLINDDIDKYIEWLTMLMEDNLPFSDFKRIFTDCIKWSFTYLTKNIKNQVWYKSTNCSNSNDWFMKLSFKLGFNIIYLDITKNHKSKWLNEIEYENDHEATPIPKNKIKVISTVSRNASNELSQMMNENEKSLFFQPFQFKNSKIQNVRLKTTFDELKIISKSEAYLREGFEYNDTKVFIPSLFSKINGIDENEENFKDLIRNINGKLIRNSNELNDIKYLSKIYLLYEDFINSNEFTSKKLIERPEWKYKILSKGAQLALADVIINIVQTSHLVYNYKEVYYKVHLYDSLLNINDELIQLFNRFDYSKEVPKLIWFNDMSQINFTTSAQLILFNKIGFDVFIFSPLGINQIETFIDEKEIDIFWLSNLKEMNYEEAFNINKKKKGLFQILFE